MSSFSDMAVDLLFQIAAANHKSTNPVLGGKHGAHSRKSREGERTQEIGDAVNADATPEELTPSRSGEPKNISPGLWNAGTNDQIDPTGKSTQQVG